MPWHPAAKVHTLVSSLVRSVFHLQHEFRILQAMNAANPEQIYNVDKIGLKDWKYVQSKQWCGSGVGTCTEIVEPFKQLLPATAHAQFLVLELRAPMGTCSGQYSSHMSSHVHLLARNGLVNEVEFLGPIFKMYVVRCWSVSMKLQDCSCRNYQWLIEQFTLIIVVLLNARQLQQTF